MLRLFGDWRCDSECVEEGLRSDVRMPTVELNHTSSYRGNGNPRIAAMRMNSGHMKQALSTETFIHSYIHTYIHTYIHICIHIDRKIDR